MTNWLAKSLILSRYKETLNMRLIWWLDLTSVVFDSWHWVLKFDFFIIKCVTWEGRMIQFLGQRQKSGFHSHLYKQNSTYIVSTVLCISIVYLSVRWLWLSNTPPKHPIRWYAFFRLLRAAYQILFRAPSGLLVGSLRPITLGYQGIMLVQTTHHCTQKLYWTQKYLS